MINKQTLQLIEQMDDEYIIGGSQAVMLYLGKDIRECKDIDLHVTKPIDTGAIGMPTDLFIDRIPYQVHNGVRLIKLEKLMANKFNRFHRTPMWKDIYDFYHLLDMPYDIELLRSYIYDKSMSIDIPDDIDFSKGFLPLTSEECLRKIHEKFAMSSY